MAAMNYVLLHLVREDESYVSRMFRKSLKDNFRQGILEGLLVLVVAGVTAADMWIVHGSKSRATTFFMVMFTVIAVFIFVIAIYMFALQSRYENTVGNTIANAVSLAISNLPRSLGMAACWIVWAFALIFIGKVAATLAFMLFGLSLPGYICAILYNKVFEINIHVMIFFRSQNSNNINTCHQKTVKPYALQGLIVPDNSNR